MSYEPNQFREIIRKVLKQMAADAGIPMLYSEDCVELLMLTAAQETLLGKYLRQITGPARGVFQMETGAYRDLYQNYLLHKDPQLIKTVESYYAQGWDFEMNMMCNLMYQIAMARVYLLRIPEALPSKDDIDEMARYYKQYWNTYLGKATVEEAKTRYHRYAF